MSRATIQRKLRRPGRLLALVAGCLICLAAPALSAPGNAPGNPGGGKLSAALDARAQSGGPDLVDAIVIYRDHPGRSEGDRIRGLGGETRRQYRNFAQRAVRVPERALRVLADNPNIEFIARDSEVVAASNPARKTARWPAEPIDYSSQGWSLSVAVIDSGVGYHPDLYSLDDD